MIVMTKEIGTEMTDEERDAFVRQVAINTILDESKKWVSRFRWTIAGAFAVGSGFTLYGIYFYLELAREADFVGLGLMALAILLGIAGAFRLGRRAVKNLRELSNAIELIRRQSENSKKISK